MLSSIQARFVPRKRFAPRVLLLVATAARGYSTL